MLNENTGKYSTNLSIKHSKKNTTLNYDDVLVKTYVKRQLNSCLKVIKNIFWRCDAM